MSYFDILIYYGWRVCVHNYHIQKRWYGYLMMRNDDCIMLVEKDENSSRITADLIGPILLKGFKLYYGYINKKGRIRGIYRWSYSNRIETICV
tara:strand:+ start:389 stop:667 length:279 start_codon:yes stop_codon:yes gene_type:complete